MLPRHFRLQNNKEITYLGQRGQRWRGKYFSAAWKLRAHQSFPRFAFVVSGKVARRATKRNLLTRRLREMVREELKQYPLRPADIVLYAHRAALDADRKQLQREISQFLRRFNKNKK
jgi:ribonuclease P protein component